MEIGQRNLIKKVELQGIFDGVEEISKQIEETVKINTDEAFVPIRMELRKEVAALVADCDRLYETIGLSKRSKRGLLNLGGEVLKFLFGTMSNEDAVQITDLIKQLDSNQDLLSKEAKSTASLISELNESNKVLKRNQEKEKEAFFKDIIDAKNNVNMLMDWEHIHELHNTLSRWIFAARLEVDELRNALQFLKTGVIDPFILERKELKLAINTGNFGYNISESDVDDIYRIASLSTYVNSTSKTLYVVVKLPVTNERLADLYSVVKIPQIKSGGIMVIKEVKSLLLVTQDRKQFWQGVSFDHHRIGKNMIGRRIIWSNMRENASCEATVFNFKTDTQCEYENWSNQWEAELVTSEGYLLVWTNKREVFIDCPKEKGVLMIGEPTRIRADTACKINGSYFELERKMSRSNIIMGDMQVKVECCSKFEFLRHRMSGTVNWESEDIPDMDTQVKQLQKETDDFRRVQVRNQVFTFTPITVLVLSALGFWIMLAVRAYKGRILVNRGAETSV